MTTARPDHLHIPGTFNYRDVGGLRTARGTTIRSGVLLRSAQLCRLDTTGHDTLRRLGVATVHDLRGPAEADRMGVDILPEGVRLELTPFDSAIGAAPPHEEAAEESRHLDLVDVYTAFPSMPEAGVALTAMARSLIRGDGAVLVHCAAGKDRTGWAIATLLRAVGVTEEEILTDYLLSNAAIDALAADVARNSGGTTTLPAALLGVSVEYLAAGTESMHRLYGDLDGYLTAIGFSPELRTALHDRMVE
ncbi:tyrosine-protein phosphatase [Nocardia spumae]|uniref:tyrosine-protein phosphatase n=1 Tax=Nocardia spumae TaxID=2887190 RepID=UPI001D1485D3|nr:tyrosine-protein phosphatase [Nocardia spumae]